jgi:hypothetical protein
VTDNPVAPEAPAATEANPAQPAPRNPKRPFGRESAARNDPSKRMSRPTPLELLFVMNWTNRASAIDVAESIGVGSKSRTPTQRRNAAKQFVYRCERKPAVKKLLDEKELKLVEQSAKVQAKQLNKPDVVKRVWELADLPPERTNNTIMGQVAACKLLAQMGGHIVEQTEDLTYKRLLGKSPDEWRFIGVFRRDPVSQEELQAFLQNVRAGRPILLQGGLADGESRQIEPEIIPPQKAL